MTRQALREHVREFVDKLLDDWIVTPDDYDRLRKRIERSFAFLVADDAEDA